MRKYLTCFNMHAAILVACIISISLYTGLSSAGQSGIKEAVQRGDMADVEELIASGADIDLPDENGVTPLMAAAERGDFNMLKMLIYAGADVDVRDKAGRTALMYAAENGHIHAGDALIAARGGSRRRDLKDPASEQFTRRNEHTDKQESLQDSGRDRQLPLNSMREELRSLYANERFKEAERLGEFILDGRIHLSGRDSLDAAIAAQDLGAVYEADGENARAKSYYQLALGIRERALGPGDPLTAETLGKLGMLELKEGNLSEAEALLSRALNINKAVFGADHPVTAWSMRDMAALLKETSREADAGKMLADSEKVLSATHRTTAWGTQGPASLSGVPEYSEKDRRLQGKLLGVLASVAVPVLLVFAYKTGIITWIISYSPFLDRRIRDKFHARTLFSKACNMERGGKLVLAAAMYEDVLDLNQDNHRARFQLARLLQNGLKDNLKARKHYAILMRKLPRKHAYYMEAVDAVNKINKEGLI